MLINLQSIIVDQPISGLSGVSFNKCTTLADVLAMLAAGGGGLGPQGDPGPAGPIGATGAPGPAGVSVIGAALVDVSGATHLVLTLSDGSTLDAGAIPCCTETAPVAANQRCYAYGYGIWGGVANKWLDNSAFTSEAPTPFFPAALTVVGGYLKLVGSPSAQPLTLPSPTSLTLSGPALLVDKFVGIGLGLAALDQLINSIPEFATYGITFHAGRNPYWAVDYNTMVVEDLGLVFRDSSNGGARSTDYVLRVGGPEGSPGAGDAFLPPTTQAEAEDPSNSIYDLNNLYQSETVCITL